jgi:hypothetical protein
MMKIEDKRHKNYEVWQVGDVVTDDDWLGMIVLDQKGRYDIMPISTDEEGGEFDFRNLSGVTEESWDADEFWKSNPAWHKVNAKLVIED